MGAPDLDGHRQDSHPGDVPRRPPDSMLGKIGVRTLALSAKDGSTKAAVKDTAR